MTRLDRLRGALASIQRLSGEYPWSKALQSVSVQLDYLISLEKGEISDVSRLKDINIGVIAAREIEDMDPEVAMQIH